MSEVAPSPAPFDMPDTSHSFAERAGWVVNRLALDLQLTNNQAAGIIGNCGYESEGLAVLQEIRPLAGRGGYGWAMWTGPRRRAFEAWCALHDLDPASDRANFGYLVEELLNAPVGQRTLRALRVESTLERCVFVVGRLYETPGGTTETHLPAYTDRLTWARQALAGAVGLGEIGKPGPTATAKNSRVPTSSRPMIRVPAHPVHSTAGGMGIGLALNDSLVWALSGWSISVPDNVQNGWVLLLGIIGAVVLHSLPWLRTEIPQLNGE